MKLIERLIEEGGSDSGSRNFVGPKISENVVRLIGRHFPSYVESDSSKKKKKKHRENVWTATAGSDVVQSGRPIFDDFFQQFCLAMKRTSG
ncbi:hypothetical protein TNCV_1965021 [Trichonephila clavipes]|nr:hypothetical protein TNCV_1965021 [Trichonephila clavipes]